MRTQIPERPKGPGRAPRTSFRTALILLAAASAFLVWKFLPRRDGPADRPPAFSSLIPGAGSLADHDLLVVTLDTTRADRIGCYGNRAIETPTLDRLAAEGIQFSSATAVAPTTLPAHSSLFTGLYPARHGARANGVFRLDERNVTLAEVLKKAGYRTGAVISSFVLDSQFGLDQGFDQYVDDLSDAEDPLDRHYRSRTARRTTDRAIAWLREAAPRRFFLWVHYFDPHHDYDPPSPFAQTYAHNLYDGEIAFVDSELGRLLHVLDGLGLSERCLVAVAGDHGEGLGEHGEYTHGSLTYEETLQVPLILCYGRSGRSGTRRGGGLVVDRPVSQVDLMPTVLALLGIDSGIESDGVSLTEGPAEGRPLYFETLTGTIEYGWEPLIGVRSANRKYIHSSAPELYDLARDPDEERNLLVADPGAADDLVALLPDLFGPRLQLAHRATPTVQPSLEDLERLQALGYLGGGAPAGGEAPAARGRPQDKVALLNRVELAQRDTLTMEESVAELREVLRVDPDFYPAWFALGLIYRDAGDLDRAAEALSECVRLKPDGAQSACALALVRSLQNQNEEVLRLLEPVVEQYPDYVRSRSLYGVVLGRVGRFEEAAIHLRAVFRLDPDYENCLQQLVAVFTRLGRITELQSLLEEQLERDPGAEEIRMALVGVLERSGDYRSAVALLREALLESPGEPRTVNRLARLLGSCPDPEVRDPRQAIALLQPFAEPGSEEPALMFTLCGLYASAGLLDEAQALARHARSLAKEAGEERLVEAFDRQLQRLDR